MIEGALSRVRVALVEQCKTAQRMSWGKARGQLDRTIQLDERGTTVTEGELQFRQSRVRKAKLRCQFHGLTSRSARTRQIPAPLHRVTVGEQFAGGAQSSSFA